MMHIMVPIILYISLTIAVFQNWIVVAVTLAAVFSFRYSAAALIPLAVVVDGYFGFFYATPYLSIAAVLWYIMVEYLRPKLFNLRFTTV